MRRWSTPAYTHLHLARRRQSRHDEAQLGVVVAEAHRRAHRFLSKEAQVLPLAFAFAIAGRMAPHRVRRRRTVHVPGMRRRRVMVAMAVGVGRHVAGWWRTTRIAVQRAVGTRITVITMRWRTMAHRRRMRWRVSAGATGAHVRVRRIRKRWRWSAQRRIISVNNFSVVGTQSHSARRLQTQHRIHNQHSLQCTTGV